MSKCKYVCQGFASSLGVLIYISLVAILLQNGEKIFGPMNNYAGPVSFLMLFVFSALITGTLILGRPIYLFTSGFRGEGIKLFLYNAGWLFIFTVIILLIQIK